MNPFTSRVRQELINYLILGVFVFVAFFPVSSFLFALKNDALTDNFPNKYFFSAAIHSGYLPIWNPYVNFGLPLYADPGFAFWHPLTWIFGVIGYNSYTLSIEVLVYIWLGGIFMFELGRYFRHPSIICFCMAAMYMCCGFFIGNLQHINFLTCAAFLPLVIRTYLPLLSDFTYKRLLYCILSLCLLASGGHPAIPFATVYFLFVVLLGTILFRSSDQKKENDRSRLILLLRSNLLLILFFTLVAAPLLYSYLEIYPYFNRSQAVEQFKSLDTGFSIPSYLSFLFPFATTASSRIFTNDPLMRNGYFSFIGLAVFVVALIQKKNYYQRIFLAAGFMMLVFSLGGAMKESIYPHLPLLKYIRTNGEFRVFALFSFIIVASFPLHDLIKGKNTHLFNRILIIIAASCLVGIVWIAIHPSNTLIFSAAQQNPEKLTGAKIKWWLDHWTLYDRAFLNFILLMIFVAVYFGLRKRFRAEIFIPVILAIDLLVFCWTQLPVTGVQKRSVATIERYFSSIKPGIPIPTLEPIENNRYSGENLQQIIGCWSYYNKQPGTPEWCDYPTLFTSTENYFKSNLPPALNLKPFLFLEPNPDPHSSIYILKYSPTAIDIVTHLNIADTLVLMQNFFPNWKVRINDKPSGIQKKYISFMSIPLKEGKNKIHIYFKNSNLLICLFVTVGGFLFILMMAFREKKMQKRFDL